MLSGSNHRLGYLPSDRLAQPGSYIDFEGQTYTVLERLHRYRFRVGRYQLAQVVLQVQPLQSPIERSRWGNQWVLGDATCRFNAHSELVRCAVNPAGPCEGCHTYEAVALSPVCPR
ncbi:MAG: DUF6464 family protein [Cyanobacteria bacterium J06648_16]